MKTKLFLLGVAALMLSACGGAKKPVSISGKQITINNALLEKKLSLVPKDPYLSKQNYAYEIFLKPSADGIYLVENDLVAKTFLLAHSSQKMTIIGSKHLITKYKDYFVKNGVNAEIYLQPIEVVSKLNNECNCVRSELDPKFNNGVQVLFFNKRR